MACVEWKFAASVGPCTGGNVVAFGNNDTQHHKAKWVSTRFYCNSLDCKLRLLQLFKLTCMDDAPEKTRSLIPKTAVSFFNYNVLKKTRETFHLVHTRNPRGA